MKGRLLKFVSGLLTVCMVFTGLGKINLQVSAEEHSLHVVEAGESFEGNPLKGMIPFAQSTTDFPHSMEWFYIPVSDVQKGMEVFDWTKFEQELKKVAARGHQAVVRFYYDYPGMETGVPQFLIDAGLEMKYYNEPESLGGAGYCPDYENIVFRQSMKNFIEAFGKQYDGDGRIGFITMGLLGFWGEWHNWPYDEDLSDGKPDWSISTTVYKEVLEAFDNSFQITRLCVREPKSGIDYSNYDIGFHDDSFGYSTLSLNSGGQSWSFMQKLFDADLQNRWQTNCIGGEIYPPSQWEIFSGAEPNGNFQNFEACVNESHATWMICENIKYYTGDTLIMAKQASKSMGYDFRVSNAYYDNVGTASPFYLRVDIKNIGTAPFYYDHTLWPVEIGMKSGDTVVKTWKTAWDLCDIAADGKDYSFEYTVENHQMPQGDYTLCMRVVNPVENGNILGFANKEQGSDGWLKLGDISITDYETETTGTPSEETTTAKVSEETTTSENPGDNQLELVAEETGEELYCKITNRSGEENWQLYIDADNSGSTGYIENDNGFEYMIENGTLYYHASNDNTWDWTAVPDGAVEVTENDNGMEIILGKTSINGLADGAKVLFKAIDNSWSVTSVTAVVPVKKKTTDNVVVSQDLEINGYQISTTVGGMRTVYSVDSTVEGQNVTEVGLIYGLGSKDTIQEDMVSGSDSKNIFVSKGTDEFGKFAEPFSKAESYAMTVQFAAGTVEEYTQTYCVRAYAKLQDGTYVYTDVYQYTIYYIADNLYQNRKMPNNNSHTYLYENILKKVDEEYKTVDYDWSNIVV